MDANKQDEPFARWFIVMAMLAEQAGTAQDISERLASGGQRKPFIPPLYREIDRVSTSRHFPKMSPAEVRIELLDLMMRGLVRPDAYLIHGWFWNDVFSLTKRGKKRYSKEVDYLKHVFAPSEKG